MSKNVEINYKNEDGSYEALYPMVQYENVGDGVIVPEAIVETYDGAIVVASNESKTTSGLTENGIAKVNLPGYGTWNLSSTYGNFSGHNNIEVDTVKQYNISIVLNMPSVKVKTVPGANVVATHNHLLTSEIAGDDGIVILYFPDYGDWAIQATFENDSNNTILQVTQDIQYEVTLYLLPSEYTISSMDWGLINYCLQKGKATSFSIGDYKQLELNGQAGSLNFNNVTAYAIIIGINHNSSREGNNKLHFQLALDGGNTKLLGNAKMNNTNSNSGGWNSCQMRTRECASLFNCLPSELQNVIKTTTKYASAGDRSSNIVASSDKIFLLSVFEERDYQLQYNWYTNHGKIKYYQEVASPYYLRSPSYDSSSSFCGASTGGVGSTYGAMSPRGVAPCFCI